jgi:hypothetical protein
MRVTIIKDDDMVYVDGLPLRVDCSSLPERFHALQWYGTWGDVEMKDSDGRHVDNIRIEDMSAYQRQIDAWTKEKAKFDAAQAAALAAAPPIKTTAKGAVNVIA